MNTDARRCSERVGSTCGSGPSQQDSYGASRVRSRTGGTLTPTGGKIDVRHRTLNPETSRIARQPSQADALRAV